VILTSLSSTNPARSPNGIISTLCIPHHLPVFASDIFSVS
jgi:hypothetical protein